LPRPRSPTSIICGGRRIWQASKSSVGGPGGLRPTDKFRRLLRFLKKPTSRRRVLAECPDNGTEIVNGQEGAWSGRGRRRGRPRGGRSRRLSKRKPVAIETRAEFSMFEGRTRSRTMPAQWKSMPRGRRAPTTTPTSSMSVQTMKRAGRRLGKQTRRYCSRDAVDPHPRPTMDWRSSRRRLLTLGHRACPPYHLAIVIGGTSAEMTIEDREARPPKYRGQPPRQGRRRPRLRDLAMEAEQCQR